MSKPSAVYRCSDLGNAELFAALYRGKVLYDHLRKHWLVWNNVRWRRDDDGAVYRLAKGVMRKRRELAEQIEDDKIRQAVITWALGSENASRIEAMLKLAAREKGIADNGRRWDASPMLLGFEDAIVDLRTGQKVQPLPSMRITQSTGTQYEPAADCPRWIETLNAMWPDAPEIVNYVQRVFGYSITGSTKEQALFCFYGDGQNGKSTMLGAITHALGDYAYTMPFSTIEFVNRSSVSNDVAALYARRFVQSSETQEDIRLNEGRIKSLTGDSSITARFLYQENFTFQPVGKFHLAFNHKPRVYDDSHGFWRRLKLIKVHGIFDGMREIKGFESTLATEAPGILNWLIKGCLLWQEHGLATPDIVVAATEEYRLESNPLRTFIEEQCVVGDKLRVISADLWEQYQNWSKTNGERYPLSRAGFGRRLNAMGFEVQVVRVDGKPLRVWNGLTVAKMADEPPIAVDDDEVIH